MQTVSEESETESQGDATSNLPICPSSRPRLKKGFSFIKQESLFNLVSSIDALEDSMDDTSKEPSNNISEESNHRRPPNRQLPSSRVLESEMDFDCDDGLEELRRELEGADLLQEESIDEGKLEASQQETLSSPRRVSEHTGSILENSKMMQTVSEESETESQGDATSNLPICPSSRPRLKKGFSFIKQESLFNLVSSIDALEDSMDDTSKEPSNNISEESNHRRPPNRQLPSSRVLESEMDFDCDDGLEELRRELEGADLLQMEPSASRDDRDHIDTFDRVAWESSSLVKKSCKVEQNQLAQVLIEKNNALSKQLSEETWERNQLKERLDVALLEGKLTLDGKDVNSQKWVADTFDKPSSKRKQALWVLFCSILASLLLGFLPLVVPIFSLLHGRISTIILGDEALPFKITTAEERELLHHSELQDAKHALAQAKTLLIETHETACKFVEDQLLMDNVIQILRSENAQLKLKIDTLTNII